MVVFTFAEGVYDLNKDILEKVICQFTVFGEHVDGGINFCLMAMKKCGKCGFISGQVEINKLLVIERLHLHTTRFRVINKAGLSEDPLS